LGQLPMQPATENVVALVRLFGSAAQLVVPRSSPIRTPYDLRKTRVAIGNHGSGSALSAELFFRSLGIWEEITPIYANVTMSLSELSQWGVEAVWLLVGFPNQALQETNRTFPIRLIDLTEEVVLSGFFSVYPSYSLARIPSGTYVGQDLDIFTFQNSILWVANRETDEELVYRALKILFNDQSLARMRSALPAAKDLDVKKGLRGVKIPLHPGAVRFLRDALFPPDNLLSDLNAGPSSGSLAALIKPDPRQKTARGD
jgi:TRAP transporter TAXI family solute receptor